MLAIVYNGTDKKDIFGVFSGIQQIRDGILRYYSSFNIKDVEFIFTNNEIKFKCKLNDSILIDRVFLYKEFKLNELFTE